MLANGGVGENGNRVLKPETISMMMTNQFEPGVVNSHIPDTASGAHQIEYVYTMHAGLCTNRRLHSESFLNRNVRLRPFVQAVQSQTATG